MAASVVSSSDTASVGGDGHVVEVVVDPQASRSQALGRLGHFHGLGPLGVGALDADKARSSSLGHERPERVGVLFGGFLSGPVANSADQAEEGAHLLHEQGRLLERGEVAFSFLAALVQHVPVAQVGVTAPPPSAGRPARSPWGRWTPPPAAPQGSSTGCGGSPSTGGPDEAPAPGSQYIITLSSSWSRTARSPGGRRSRSRHGTSPRSRRTGRRASPPGRSPASGAGRLLGRVAGAPPTRRCCSSAAALGRRLGLVLLGGRRPRPC